MSNRRKIKCVKCGAEQSTHSSNRQHCHKCVPKCREKHSFHNLGVKKQKEKKAETVDAE